MRVFHCKDGMLEKDVLMPDKHCVFCQHVDDIIWDFTHGVYMCFCDLEDHYTHVDCKDFIESEVI